MAGVVRAAKDAVKSIGGIIRLGAKESRFLESVLEDRFLSFGAEPTNICDAMCPFCAYRYSKETKRIMPLDIFERAVEEYHSAGGGGINLTPTIGEPLMDRTIIDKIRIAKARPSINNIFFYSNLLNLRKVGAERLLTSGIRRISVSTALGSKEMYARLFGVDRYETMLANLIELLETNIRLRRPVSIILALRFDDTFDYKNSADYRKISDLMNGRNITHLPNERGYDNWGGVIQEEDLPKGASFRRGAGKKKEPCAELYRRINVLADGRVNFCVCRDFKHEMVIGNIRDNGLLDVWRGEPMRKIREDWKSGKVPEMCLRCSMYTPLSEFLRKSRLSIWMLWKRIKDAGIARR